MVGVALGKSEVAVEVRLADADIAALDAVLDKELAGVLVVLVGAIVLLIVSVLLVLELLLVLSVQLKLEGTLPCAGRLRYQSPISVSRPH